MPEVMSDSELFHGSRGGGMPLYLSMPDTRGTEPKESNPGGTQVRCVLHCAPEFVITDQAVSEVGWTH